MQLRIESTGGVASRVEVGGHEVRFDQPVKFGGTDAGPSPLDLLVASVGACVHYYAAAWLVGRNYPTEGLYVDVDSTKADAPKRVSALAFRVCLPAGVPSSASAGIERAIRTCPALGTLGASPTVGITVDAGAAEPAVEAAAGP